MLTIIDAGTAERKHVCALITAFPGRGKTTLGLATRNGLLMSFDPGLHRAEGREGKAAVDVQSWADLERFELEDLTNSDGVVHSPLVVDTAGEMLNQLAIDIMTRNTKLGSGGALNQRGWGELRRRFDNWILPLLKHSDIVLLAHIQEEKDGDETKERMVMQGSSKQTCYQHADLMARLIKRPDGVRVLTAGHTDRALTKCPTGWQDRIVKAVSREPYALDDALQHLKDCLSNEDRRRKAAEEQVLEWKTHIETLTTPEEFTRAAGEAKTDLYKRITHDAAKAKGMEWDKDTKGYRLTAEAQEAARQQKAREDEAAARARADEAPAPEPLPY